MDTIKARSYTFMETVWQEIQAICGNITVMFIVIVGSLLYAVLYPTPYYKDIVLKQKIAVIDFDNTTLSKDFIFAVNAHPNIEVSYNLYSLKQAQELLEKHLIYGILSIPRGFQANANKGVPTKLLYRANASYFLVYGAIIEGLNDVGNAFSSQIKHKMHLVQKQIDIAKDSTLVHFTSIPLFNYSMGYINYALAAILVFILHQTLIAGSMVITATQNRLHKQGIKAYFNTCSVYHLFLARILVFTVIYSLLFLLYFGLFFKLYGIHIHAHIVDFWCFSVIFIVCCASFGIFLGSFISNVALPTQIILLSSLPLVFMMGFIYPIHLLPSFLQTFVHFIPAYHGINGLIKLNQMSASMRGVMPHFYALSGIFICCTWAALYRLQGKYHR
ncbi:ABC transporter permease [Helicobacter aurati]|uniref:ABC transporter permease n=1 Tax=Helicobacter aurati TaxID=137778 RepID=A0A3D8J0J2_9HELI|nr:ABC transporter permease [Helicobacter aurati]RDU71037.1 ABC transporter permease [Helicobacter aurati]